MAAMEETQVMSPVEEDDPRNEIKKKKFKPFQKVRNFFKGSKKRKGEEGGVVSVKAHSTSALHKNGNDLEEDEDDGGFKSRQKPLASGSRSISEDSIFKTEPKEPTVAKPFETTVSMENINSFKSELFSKLKGKACSSDTDEGLSVSPPPTLTSADILLGEGVQLRPKTGKSTSLESEKSLISVDGSEGEDDPFSSNWKSGVASVIRTKRPLSTGSMSDVEVDIEAVEATKSLSSDAAKHRISIKPKTRRSSTKQRAHRKTEYGGAQSSPLPRLKEESPTKVLPPADSELKKGEGTDVNIETRPGNVTVTVISTTANSGAAKQDISQKDGVKTPEHTPTDFSRSQPIPIPKTGVSREPESPSKAKLAGALSTSPLSQSMLEGVKLRSRPVEKSQSSEYDTGQSDNSELSQALTKRKRLSMKWEEESGKEGGNIDKLISSSKGATSLRDAKVPERPTSIGKDVQEKPALVKKDSKESDKIEKRTGSVKESKSVEKSSPVTSPGDGGIKSPDGGVKSPTTGFSFVLKKEPLKPGSKVTDSGVSRKEPEKLTSPSIDSVAKSDTKTVSPTSPMAFKDRTEIAQKMVEESKDSKSEVSVTVATSKEGSPKKIGSPEKLASPKEEYKLKRQVRSKTLPEHSVPREILDKSDSETSPAHKPASGQSSSPLVPPKHTGTRKGDYDNVVIGNKSSENKRASWVGGGSVTEAGEPSWIGMAKRKQSEQKPAESKSDTKPVGVKTSDKQPVLQNVVKPLIGAKPSLTKTDSRDSVKKSDFKPEVSSVRKPVVSDQKKEQVEVKKSVSELKKEPAEVQKFEKKDTIEAKKFEKKDTVEVKKSEQKKFEPKLEKDKKEKDNNRVTDLSQSMKTPSVKSNVFENKSASLSRSIKADSTIPQWKRDLSSKKKEGNGVDVGSNVKIEIIEKSPEKKVEQKPAEKKVEEKANVQLRDKAKTEKCADTAANRQSKVLDMVKNWQKLQVS